MKLAGVGFGNAGTKIADKFVEFERESGRKLFKNEIAINTAEVDLGASDYIDRKILIGKTHQNVRGGGVGGDPKLGARVTQDDFDEIRRAMDDVHIHEVDAFLIIAGLGGGTGSGGAPVMASELQEMYGRIPVYGLGVLPGRDEGDRPSLNTAMSLQSFNESVDNLILFDNDPWRTAGDSVETGFQRINHEIAKRVVTLLAAGELDGSQVSDNAMDASDIRRTLDPGGISTIGYAENQLDTGRGGLLDRFTNGLPEDGEGSASEVFGLVEQAVESRLTCPANIKSTERALIVVSGPPDRLSRKGLERARDWVQDRADCSDVLAGDDPRVDSPVLSATVILSNVVDIPRIKELQEQAENAKQRMDQLEAVREEKQDALINDTEIDGVL